MKTRIALILAFLICVSIPVFAMQTMTPDDGAPIRGPLAARQFSDTAYQVVLTANSSQQITIPASAGKVLFAVTAGNDFWVQPDAATCSVPTQNNTTGTTLALNPLAMITSTHTSICIVAGVACTVNFEWYK